MVLDKTLILLAFERLIKSDLSQTILTSALESECILRLQEQSVNATLGTSMIKHSFSMFGFVN